LNWTTEVDLKQQVERRWKRGDLLRALVIGDPAFPLRLRLRAPDSRDLSANFGAAQDWLETFVRIPRIRVEWKAIRSMYVGAQRLPDSVWIESVEDALAFVDRQAEAGIYCLQYKQTKDQVPSLIPWLLQQPLRALQFSASWEHLLQVVTWIREHPTPAVFMRQMDVPGIDTKFLEDHAGILTHLLDGSLDPTRIDQSHRGTGLFAQRYGFLSKPNRIRFRVLDPTIRFAGMHGTQDVELDAESFANLKLPLRCVFVTENEINLLAFPSVYRAIVIFGGGYKIKSLGLASWLAQLPLYYWGDIDTHGFKILDQLRGVFPQTQSFLMDRGTLLNNRASWGTEPVPVRHSLSRLTDAESSLFRELQENLYGQQVRLEQERVLYSQLTGVLQELPE
jgi:hypothetical protein